LPNHEYNNSYISPCYTRLETMDGKTATDISQAALLAFLSEFPDLPINSVNTDFLRYCFEQYIDHER
jgi:hypothetical protein